MTATLLGSKIYLVQIVRTAPGESQYYINGFSQLSPQVKKFLAFVSLSSYLPDAVLAILLQDDRVPLVLEAIDQEICEELQLLATLPREVWLAMTVGMGLDEALQLRHGCISSAAAAAAFIQSGLQYARRHPWSLCKGNIDENLSKLAAGGCPTKETAKKVWTLAKINFPRAALKVGLERMRDPYTGLRGCYHARQSIRFPSVDTLDAQ